MGEGHSRWLLKLIFFKNASSLVMLKRADHLFECFFSALGCNIIGTASHYFIISMKIGIPKVMLNGKVIPSAIGIYNPGSASGAAKRIDAGTAM